MGDSRQHIASSRFNEKRVSAELNGNVTKTLGRVDVLFSFPTLLQYLNLVFCVVFGCEAVSRQLDVFV